MRASAAARFALGRTSVDASQEVIKLCGAAPAPATMNILKYLAGIDGTNIICRNKT